MARPPWSQHRTDRPFQNDCCWPNCKATVEEPGKMPLCRSHLMQAYRWVSDETFWMFKHSTSHKQPPPKPLQYEPVVYFVRFRDRVKIGYSTWVRGRLVDIPHDEVLAVVPGDRKTEASYHKAFKDLCVGGEWFEAAQDLLDFAASLRKRHPLPDNLGGIRTPAGVSGAPAT